MTACLKNIDVVVLAGGLGTRISGVLKGTPKVLAPIGGRPYLDLLFEWLEGFGTERVVLCLGHLSGAVADYLASHPPEGLEVTTVVEPKPMGTAGAVALARPTFKTNPVMVMNGDSFTGADLCAFVTTHRKMEAMGTVLCTEVADAGRYGKIELSPEGRILGFAEKNPDAGPGVINAGIYLFSEALLDRISQAPGPSLEKDVFEALPPGTLAAYSSQAPFIDIGTPESLAAAENFFGSL